MSRYEGAPLTRLGGGVAWRWMTKSATALSLGVNAGLSAWSVSEQSAVAHTRILCMSPLCPPLQGLRQ